MLTSIVNERGYNTGTETLEKLCRYFGCRIEGVAEYVPDDPGAAVAKPAAKRSKK